MGSDFQLTGNQEDLVLQNRALAYLKAVNDLMGQSTEAPAEGTALLLVNEVSFHLNNEKVIALTNAFCGECNYSSERFNALDKRFMFDNANKGLICSTTAYPLDDGHEDSDAQIVGAGLRYRGPWVSELPLDAAIYYVLKRLFVPNLCIDDDQLLYQKCFEAWDETQAAIDAETGSPADRYWLKKWARVDAMSAKELAEFTLEFHNAAPGSSG
jgi:hypothetical protein